MRLRPCHDLLTVRPRPDLHARLHGLDVPGGSLVGPDGKPIRIDCPIGYQVTSKRDQFAIVEVVDVGPGVKRGSGSDLPEVTEGDIIGTDLGQVGHVLPSGLWTLQFRAALCSISAERTLLPLPLSSWVMTMADAEAEARLTFSGTSKLITPSRGHNGVATSDVRKTKVRLRAERLLAWGSGKFAQAAVGPDYVPRPGRDIPLYMPGGTVHLMWPDGRRLAFTPWSEIIGVITDD